MNDSTHNNIINDINLTYHSRINEINKAIDRIGNRQDEIKSYILSIDQSINQLELDIQTCQNAEQRLRIRVAIQKNTELIANLFNSISSFESIRQRYQQDLNKLSENKLRLISIDLRKIEEQFNNTQLNETSKFIQELRELIEKAPKKVNVDKIKTDLNTSPEYSMD